jgi:hypothetical protein
MTRAPTNLLALRTLLLRHLDVDPSDPDRDSDLNPNEVGIVGDPTHRGGYHCGSDRVIPNDYSVVESPRDRDGLTLDAAAIDIGGFQIRSGGATHNLRTLSTWLVAQCRADTSDTQDIREIIYSPDGRVVLRWDRLGRRSTGDESHLWHTHISYFRDAIKAGRDQRPLFTRYFTSIGLIDPPDPPEPEMNQSEKLIYDTGSPNRTVGHVLADLQNLRNWEISRVGTTGLVNPPQVGSPAQLLLELAQQWPALVAKVDELSRRDISQSIIAGVLAELTPERIAAALPPNLARSVADELARRLAPQ